MALTRTSADVSADAGRGAIVVNKEAGAALEVGDAGYINASDAIAQADQDGASENIGRAVGIVVGAGNQYGEIAIPSGEGCGLCIFGLVYGFTGMTPGMPVWLSATPGELTQTKPSSGWRIAIGYALAADVLFVNPDSDTASSN